ncbi:MAG: hypothetical protein BWK80_21295 [Desulfobacteraceae bacterium IS3]|nr:MAG: hypothetical protein BWK80_21295 [Desulfobacteraceae bacterium IS3]
MKKSEKFDGSISKFHFAYLTAMFNERGNMTYSKSNSREVQMPTYLNELISRVEHEPSHLNTFINFLEFCRNIRFEINR